MAGSPPFGSNLTYRVDPFKGAMSLALLDKKSVRDVQVFAETAGVTIWFEIGQRLEAINNSSG